VTRRLDVVRVLVGAYSAIWLAVRLPHHVDLGGLPDHRWEPVGVLTVLGGPPPSWVAAVVAIAAILAAVAFAAGWRTRLTGLACVATLLAVTTYASSWGQLFHTENLLVLHVLVLAVVPWLRRADPGTVLIAMATATAAAYVVAGIAKIRNGGWDWVDGEALRNQVAVDNLRKAVVGAPSSPLGGLAVRNPGVFAPMAVVSLAVELGAPLALLGRRWAVGWSAAAWVFHVGVLALMAVGFPYPLAGVAFAPLLPVERLSPRSLLRRWSASSSPSPSLGSSRP